MLCCQYRSARHLAASPKHYSLPPHSTSTDCHPHSPHHFLRMSTCHLMAFHYPPVHASRHARGRRPRSSSMPCRAPSIYEHCACVRPTSREDRGSLHRTNAQDARLACMHMPYAVRNGVRMSAGAGVPRRNSAPFAHLSAPALFPPPPVPYRGGGAPHTGAWGCRGLVAGTHHPPCARCGTTIPCRAGSPHLCVSCGSTCAVPPFEEHYDSYIGSRCREGHRTAKGQPREGVSGSTAGFTARGSPPPMTRGDRVKGG